ncbi:MAG: hypothetical protein RLZZ273_665 [Bacteroidota bacterium]|jgi:hypothetical protein
MKKVISGLVLAAAMVFAAQTALAQPRFGVKAALSVSSLDYENMTLSREPELLTSFVVGGVMEAPLNDMFSLGVGLEFAGKGAKQTVSSGLGNVTVVSNPIYLQVPVLLYFNTGNFRIGAGAYGAYGVAGSVSQSNSGTSISNDIKFGSTDKDTFAPIDAGMSIELGFKISDFRVIGFINKGYMNIIPADQVDGEESVNNFAMGIGLSYMF